jgi:formylglycine-generating enzyme required for sulfatase activity
VAATVAVAYRGGNNWVNDNAPSLISEGVGFRLARSLELVAVKGGTLPSGSRFAGQAVSNFQIGEYEVTWGEWKTVRDWAVENGYSDLVDTGVGGGDNYPVTAVSWYNALKWCNARSEKEGLRPVYTVGGFVYRTKEVVPDENMWVSGYRLPKEAEWEFAAGGGNMGHGYAYSGGNNLELLGWYAGDSGAAIHECGAKLPNELGIYDMCGNTWEWCFDAFSDSMRVHKGGHSYDVSSSCLVNVRQGGSPQFSESGSGFRVVRSTLSGMVPVQGGTLPSVSEQAGQRVSDFRIARYEMTWGEWKRVRDWAAANGYTDLANVGDGPSTTALPSESAEEYPVAQVNWFDTVKWCNAKSQMEGLIPVYMLDGGIYKTGQRDPAINSTSDGFRLPTEAEWEWAARGGVLSKGYEYSGGNDINAVAWNGDNSGGARKKPGTKMPNELGIYDMSGNMWEWCWGACRFRGGGFYDIQDLSYFSVNRRNWGWPGHDGKSFGFRIARNSVQ